MDVTDERKAARDNLANLTELALALAQDRCELAIHAGDLYKEITAMQEKMDKIGQELTRLGAQEMEVHRKRKELAKLLLQGGVSEVV